MKKKSVVFDIFSLLLYMGAMCPRCGYGTRVVNKKWCRCKKCGKKIERRELPK